MGPILQACGEGGRGGRGKPGSRAEPLRLWLSSHKSDFTRRFVLPMEKLLCPRLATYPLTRIAMSDVATAEDM